jgi:hypothetical protein
LNLFGNRRDPFFVLLLQREQACHQEQGNAEEELQ